MILLGASAVACAAVASPVASALAPTPRDGTQHEQPSTARAPNILVIVADDLGYPDVGFNGASFPTPNIDRHADSGMVLDHFYTSALCSPSRAGLFSDRSLTRFGQSGTAS